MKNIIIIILLGINFVSLFSQNASTIKESFQTFKTYPFSDPDPIANPGSSYYPYFRFDGFAKEGVNKQWKVIEMENDYLKVYIFPEIGGKIWGAIDKSNGNDFIYFNDVVKFRDIAMRGAWTSGGIEMNFGIIGHSPTCSTPVDYLTRTNYDGSVSCFLSATDRITGTLWSVEVNLPKDKAYFTTGTTWYNPSPIQTPYYHWMNAAYDTGNDLEFIFPAQYAIGHGGEVEIDKLPYDSEGRNILWYKNNAYGGDKSYHMVGNYSDFYAAYWHDRKAGSVHYSPFDEKLGMKLFLWGFARSGALWEDLLTDSNGQYVELQSGRMMSQAVLSSGETPYDLTAFPTHCTDSWREYWFPASLTRGMVMANPSGSLNLIREDGYLKIYFCPVQKISDILEISDGHSLLYSKSIDKNVLELFTDSIPLSKIPGKVKVNIGDHLLFYSEFEEDFKLNRPNQSPGDLNKNSIYGRYIDAEQKMNYGLYSQAFITFVKCLDEDPYYLPALNKLAVLYYRSGKYTDALNYCLKSLSINTYDGEANYLCGLANVKLGNYTDAKAAFSIATYSENRRSAAYAELSKLYMLENDWRKAAIYSRKSLEFNTRNFKAMHNLAVIHRYSGNNEQALKIINQVLENLPLDHVSWYEKYLLSGKGSDKEKFISLIRGEFPEETLLDMARWYMSVGCNAEAIELLEMAGDLPVAKYYHAFISEKLGNEDQAMETLKVANKMSPLFVFPHKPEDLEVFQWAATKLPDWKITYYTALISWNLGDIEQSRTSLNSIDSVDFAPFYMTRAMLKSGPDKLSDLLSAEKLDPQWRTGKELINYYLATGDAVNALAYGKKYFRMYPSNNYLGLKYARTLIENEKYQECADHLRKIVVLPNEGSYEGRDVYSKANLHLALSHLKKKRYSKALQAVNDSRLWLENLGVGKPFDDQIDNCLEDFITAYIFEKQGKVDEAKNYYQSVIRYRDNPRFAKNSNNCLIAVSYTKVGEMNKALDFVDSWYQKNPDSNVVRWCNAILLDNQEEARKISFSPGSDNHYAPWEEVSHDYNFSFVIELLQQLEMQK